MKLGRIRQVALREIWKHEATDFTNWLAMPENLELLSDEIDVEISFKETEYRVGRFNVDIFAEDSTSKRNIIIENQLEKTDHDHLGKLITYASGADAEIIIWVVKEVLEEHQQAIEWLNENTDEKINFFAIKMEVWKIGDSAPAPKFHVVSKPNNWAKSAKQSVKNLALTETSILQLKFWERFKEYVLKNNINLKLRKPGAQMYYDFSFGRKDCYISLTINSQKNEIGCEIYITDSMETYFQFLDNKKEIEGSLGKLIWMDLPKRKASRIKKVVKGDFKDQKKWIEYFNWFGDTASKFQETFSRY